MADLDPPVAFHFSVSFSGDGPPISDAVFQVVSGLETGINQEVHSEGGENRFVHQLPKPAKPSNIKLKRGLTPNSSDLVKWCKSTIEIDFAKAITPKNMLISLLDEEADPVASWSITRAYPVKWAVGGFDAMKNEVAIETIELAYATLKRTL